MFRLKGHAESKLLVHDRLGLVYVMLKVLEEGLSDCTGDDLSSKVRLDLDVTRAVRQRSIVLEVWE